MTTALPSLQHAEEELQQAVERRDMAWLSYRERERELQRIRHKVIEMRQRELEEMGK